MTVPTRAGGRPDGAGAREVFLSQMAEERGVGADRVGVAGTTIVPDEDRRGSGRVSRYLLGSHVVLWCDPAMVDRIEPRIDADSALGAEPFESWSDADDAEFEGSGAIRVVGPDGWSAAEVPAGYAVERLSREREADVDRIRAFVDRADPDDLDEAEIEIDDLDPHIDAVVDGEGEIASLALARPWDALPEWADIGILTLPEHRGAGLARVAVRAVVDDIEAAGLGPVYRFNHENVGSDRLSASVGFVDVVTLQAVLFRT